MTRAPHKPLGESLGWRTRSTGTLHETPWFSLRRDEITFPDGTPGVYTYVEHPGSVMIVPVTNEGRVLLLRSYRYTLDSWCWEVPAGSMKPGQTPEACARAELLEETGYTGETFESIGRLFLGNGFARCETHVFLVRGVAPVQSPDREPGETIDSLSLVELDEAANLVTSPQQDGDSALAVLLALRSIRRGTV